MLTQMYTLLQYMIWSTNLFGMFFKWANKDSDRFENNWPVALLQCGQAVGAINDCRKQACIEHKSKYCVAFLHNFFLPKSHESAVVSHGPVGSVHVGPGPGPGYRGEFVDDVIANIGELSPEEQRNLFEMARKQILHVTNAQSLWSPNPWWFGGKSDIAKYLTKLEGLPENDDICTFAHFKDCPNPCFSCKKGN
jgi:hypothetical protein